MWLCEQAVHIVSQQQQHNNDSVYGVVIMTKVIARVQPVHLMNADWAPGAANPQTKAIELVCESTENWQLPSTSIISVVIITQPVSWYSFYRPTEGERLRRHR